MEDPKDSSSSGDPSGEGGTESKPVSNTAAGGSASQPNQQQLQLNGLSAGGLLQLARDAITSQPGASLYASDGLLAATQPALTGAGTVTTDNPSGQAMLGGSDAALNALLLSSGINLGNFSAANQAVLGSLLNDVTAAQMAGLQTGGFAGAGASGGGGAAAAAATTGGSNAAADGEDDGNKGPCGTQANNKQLSSRYRGVCWNKKNKRWQAAINSGGKYIYLGSFQSEDDAARQFDRAAIKIRGKKAKLNFLYADYVDADGTLLEDVILPVGKDDPKPTGGSGRGSRVSRGGEWAEYNDTTTLQGDMINQAALALVGRGGWGGVGGFSENTEASLGAQAINMSDLKAFLPKGCSMDYMLPGLDPGMFGLVYKHDVTGQRGCGVWTGYKFHTFGLYIEESDAKQTVLRSMELLHEDRQARGVAGPAARGAAVSNAAGEAAGAAAADQDPLIAALGLGNLRTGAAGATGAAGLFGGATGLTTSSRAGGMGGLASYDIAHAAQLAQQAAAEQGMSTAMPYLPLSVGLPTPGTDPSAALDGVWQQQQQLSSEADLQLKLQQIMQQRQDDSSKQAAGGDGGMLSRLGKLDIAQLKQQLAGSLAGSRELLPQVQQRPLDKQLMPAIPLQQQAMVSVAAPAANPITGNLGTTSIEELLAGLTGGAGKRGAALLQAATTTAAGSSAVGWADLLGLSVTGAATAGDAAALPAAKRLRVGDSEPDLGGLSGIAAAATAAGAGAGVGGGGDNAGGWSNGLSKLGIQDALKSLYAMSNPGQEQ